MYIGHIYMCVCWLCGAGYKSVNNKATQREIPYVNKTDLIHDISGIYPSSCENN